MTDRVNILIVDDLPEKLLSLQAVLDELGQNLVLAHSGREALRYVMERDFAVILLDVNMPGMDGFETAALIRQRKRSAHIPIIFITAFSDDMHTARGYSLGAVDYILSPVVPEVLRTKVGVFVDLYVIRATAERLAEERIELARAQADRAAAEKATRRSQFLAEASRVLGGSLNLSSILTGLSRLVVPLLGDVGAVLWADEAPEQAQIFLAWRQGDGGEIHDRPAPRAALHGELADAVALTLRDSRSRAFGPEPAGVPLWAEGAAPEGCSAPQLVLGHGALFPLSARGRTLGVLLVARENSATPLAENERDLAQDLANRAAVALDNARLYNNIQEADRRKNDFLAMLAHELRNPLAPIRNAIHLLRHPSAQPAQQSWAYDLIDRQVQHLVRLVDDLLDVARITRGKIQLQLETLDLAHVIASAVEASRPFLEARQHQFVLSKTPEAVLVRVDRTRFAQVLTNLLNNAAKYTPKEGRIELAVERVGAEVLIRVRDNGMGIPAEMLEHVFDMFFQVSRSLDRSEGGLGIGLTMVHRLVQMHGGEVRAFSEGANLGSEFVIRLPVAKPSPAPAPTPIAAEPSAAAATCRVLVVDDNRDAAQSMALVLTQIEHDTRVAFDGPSALAVCEVFQPHVAILDIGLPLMDGYELARQIRKKTWAAGTTLVAVTGYGQESDKLRAETAGFAHHLVKPVAPAVLLKLIADLQRQQPVNAESKKNASGGAVFAE